MSFYILNYLLLKFALLQMVTRVGFLSLNFILFFVVKFDSILTMYTFLCFYIFLFLGESYFVFVHEYSMSLFSIIYFNDKIFLAFIAYTFVIYKITNFKILLNFQISFLFSEFFSIFSGYLNKTTKKID